MHKTPLVLLAAALAALTACSTAPKPSAAGDTPTPASTETAPPPTTSAPTLAPSPTASASPKGPVTGASHAPPADPDPCPVSAGTLLKAVTRDIADRAGNPKSLSDVHCYQGYAAARTPDDGIGDRGWILFGYRRPANTWISLNLGTADYCTGYILDEEVRRHFPGCR